MGAQAQNLSSLEQYRLSEASTNASRAASYATDIGNRTRIATMRDAANIYTALSSDYAKMQQTAHTALSNNVTPDPTLITQMEQTKGLLDTFQGVVQALKTGAGLPGQLNAIVGTYGQSVSVPGAEPIPGQPPAGASTGQPTSQQIQATVQKLKSMNPQQQQAAINYPGGVFQSYPQSVQQAIKQQLGIQ
jgi:hypothetical protein